MSKSFSTAKKSDFVSAYVDEAIRNPERAEDIKKALRARFGRPGELRIAPKTSAAEQDAADTDDLWDNVPL